MSKAEHPKETTSQKSSSTVKNTDTSTKKGASISKKEEHPDATYIKRDDLGQVIAKGMAVLYLTKPSNPIDFLAKWLLNYSNTEKQSVTQ